MHNKNNKQAEILKHYTKMLKREVREADKQILLAGRARRETLQQIVIAGVRWLKHSKAATPKGESDRFNVAKQTLLIIGSLTIEELMQIFPIDKSFAGAKYCLTTLKEIRKLGMDRPIKRSEDVKDLQEVIEFLDRYRNQELMSFLAEVKRLEKAMGGDEKVWLE